MNRNRKIALAVGLLFIATFITSISAVLLYNPLLDDPSYLLGGGDETRITAGAVLELLLIVANIGTAVVLYPVLKRQSEIGAVGYVTARLMESAFIAVGVISLLAVVTLSEGPSGNPGSLDGINEALVAVHDWTFSLGPGFVVGIGNGLLLGYLMLRSGLVPRWMPALGLIGGPAICLTGILLVLGVIDEGSAARVIATAPEFVWELSLGIYLTVRGFKPSPVLDEPSTP